MMKYSDLTNGKSLSHITLQLVGGVCGGIYAAFLLRAGGYRPKAFRAGSKRVPPKSNLAVKGHAPPRFHVVSGGKWCFAASEWYLVHRISTPVAIRANWLNQYMILRA